MQPSPYAPHSFSLLLRCIPPVLCSCLSHSRYRQFHRFILFSHAPLSSTHPAGRFGTHSPASLSTDPLASRLDFLQSQAIAPSMRRTYSFGICRYATFCLSRQCNPFPASELQLRYFASWLCDQVSFPTIKLYLAGIRLTHLENSLADPFADAPLLHLLLQGIKRTLASPLVAIYLSPCQSCAIKGALADNPQIASQDKLMLWSAFTLTFFGFLRSSEFTSPSSTHFKPLVHLASSDISFTFDGSLLLQLKASKTDPFQMGCSITLVLSGHLVCAVWAMYCYLAPPPPGNSTPL